MSTLVSVLVAVLAIVVVFLVVKPRSYYSHEHPILDEVRENFRKLDERYASIPLRYGNSAYTEDKAVITLCLKDPHTNEYYDMNTIMYVAIHELAHVVSKTHGHGREFKKNFSRLLRKADRQGIYDPRKTIAETYCGIGPDD